MLVPMSQAAVMDGIRENGLFRVTGKAQHKKITHMAVLKDSCAPAEPSSVGSLRASRTRVISKMFSNTPAREFVLIPNTSKLKANVFPQIS